MGLLDAGIEQIALEKAIIEIIDLTQKGNSTKYAQKPIKASGGTNDVAARATQLRTVKVKHSLGRAQAMLVAGATMSQSNQAIDMPEALNDDVDAIEGACVRRFTVQFNPSTLNINGTGGGLVQLTNFAATAEENEGQVNNNNAQRGISYGEASRHIEMSVQLVFDDTNNLIAFPGDITGINISSALQTGGQAAIKAIKKRPEIQDEVEAFLAAIRNEYTRTVTFAWGKMIYSGYVNRVGAKYTLFNPSGKPVRATVDMTIVCTDSDVSPDTMGYWEDKYKEFFNADKSYAGYKNSLVNLSTFGG